MPKKLKTTRRAVLRLPDLDYSKSAVLNTLRSPGSRRAYEFALTSLSLGTVPNLVLPSIGSW